MKKPTTDRFFSKTRALPNNCWGWAGAKNRGGYACLHMEGVKGRQVSAHRWAYEHFIGPLEPGKVLDHRCHNRWCVNPWHLEQVTQRVNATRGRGATMIAHRDGTCVRGHPMAARPGARPVCLVCKRNRVRDAVSRSH